MSVILPTVGGQPLLADALQSALGQVEVELEVIVVDDGSADDTAERLRRIDDARLHVHRHGSQRGTSAARNTAIAHARGEWLAFLDDDDVWAPDNLRLKLAALRSAGADVAYGGAIMTDEQNTPLYLFEVPDPANILPLLLRSNVIPGGPSSVVARSQLVRDLGAFDEQFAILEDWDMFIRLAAAGRFTTCPETLLAYRRHGTNISGDRRFRVEAALGRLMEKHAVLGERYGVGFDQQRVIRWSAYEHRRRELFRAEREAARGRRWAASALYLLSAARNRRLEDLRAGVLALSPRRSRATRVALEQPAWLAPRSL